MPEPNVNPMMLTESRSLSAEASEPDKTPTNPNNENLPQELQDELLRLVDKYTLEDSTARRAEVRQIRKAREFWRNRQYLYWSDQDQTWKVPGVDTSKADDPLYQYVTNIYQAYGLTFAAAISSNPPHVRFWPQSVRQESDVATARAATDIAEFIERNNRLPLLLQDDAFYLWTDGTVCSYTHYVVDGERYGYKELPVMGEEMQPVDEFGTMAPVPVQVGTKKIPLGQEQIDVFGRLEVKLPNYARDMSEFPYLIWSTEIHKAKLCSVYPKAAKKIKAGGGAAEDDYERNARIGLTSSEKIVGGFAGENQESLVTFRRCWLRKWIFADCDEGIRAKLEKIFPDGVYVAFAGDTYCESRNECMDYYWKVCHGLPGDGQTRDAVGTPLISIQERYNTLSNIMIETYEHGIPTTFFDSQAIDGPAWQEQGNRPGARLPVRRGPGENIRNIVDTTQAGTPPESLVNYASDMLGPVAQFVMGLYPALFGGETGQETASGYAMQRDQAMGRIGLIYRRLKEFHADTMFLAVECFRKNRSGEVEIALLGAAGQFDSKLINLDELAGAVKAYPETSEDFPASWTAKKNAFMDIINSQNPAVQGFIGETGNMVELLRIMGISGLKAPGEGARSQQYREIRALLESQPQEVPMATDPMTNGPVENLDGSGPITMLVTSVPVDPILDNHQAHLGAIMEWSESDEGQLAKQENPVGYQNVRLHAEAHQQFIMQAMMAQAQPQGTNPEQPASQTEDEPPAEVPIQ